MMRCWIVFAFALLSFESRSGELTLSPAGLGFHTLRPRPEGLVKLMPRKWDSSGHVVFTPGVALIYRWEPRYQVGFLAISDSFSNPAVAATYGMSWKTPWEGLNYGLVAGVYFRKSIKGCHSYNAELICISYSRDLPVKFEIGNGSSRTDIAPLLMGQLTYKVPVSKNFSIEANFYTAFYISFLNVGIRFPLFEEAASESSESLESSEESPLIEQP